MEPKPSSAVNDSAAAAFWQWIMILGPPAATVLPPLAVSLFGGFDDFAWINKPVTFLQAFATLGALCFPFGTFHYARSRWNQARARVSRSWPTVTGLVQTSAIDERQTTVISMYRLTLLYRYQVAGNRYEGDAVQFGPKYVTAGALIEDLAKKYPPGTEVNVHYDPADPAISVIETSDEIARQNRWQIWAYFGTPFLLSVVAAIKNSI